VPTVPDMRFRARGRSTVAHPLPYPGRMRTRGAWERRGFAIAAITLCLTAAAPLATPAGAASSSRIALAAKVRRPMTKAARARFLAALRRAGVRRAQTATKPTARYRTPTRRKPKAGARRPAVRRALTARQRRAQQLAARRRAARARALHGKKTATHKPAPLSVPELAGFAIAPFVLMGIYLLGADHMRRRVPRKRRRRASLVITRVSDR
jgi:hypothetical protein